MSWFRRAGLPQHINGTTSAGTVDQWSISVGITNVLIINNTHASEVLTVYLTEDAMNRGEGFGIRPGFGHEFYVECRDFWTLTTNAGSFQAIAIGRI